MIKSSLTLLDDNWAFAEVLDDVLKKGRQGKAVVVYPRSSIETFSAGSALPANWESMKGLMQGLFEADVVIVTCAGNEGTKRSSALDKAPAVWASQDFPLIVAGAVTTSGDFAKFSQGLKAADDLVWAPGVHVTCA